MRNLLNWVSLERNFLHTLKHWLDIECCRLLALGCIALYYNRLHCSGKTEREMGCGKRFFFLTLRRKKDIHIFYLSIEIECISVTADVRRD